MRSLLFVPADNEKKLTRAAESEADGLILDLEDSVAPGRKQEARVQAAAFLRGGCRGKGLYVRVNEPLSPEFPVDLAAVMPGAPDGIMLPKCSSGEDVRLLAHRLLALERQEGLEEGSTAILPIVTERAAGLFAMDTYSGSSPRLWGLMWGAEDLSAEIGASERRRLDGGYDDPYRMARAMTLLAATAAGVVACDTVYSDYRDSVGLEVECRETRRMGFRAKAAIHPDQLEIINRLFSASAEELEWARRVTGAFEDQPEAGVIGLDGVMLDKPHLIRARQILARAGEQGTELETEQQQEQEE